MGNGKSGIPKVMGILMIIFASLGLLGSLWGLLSSSIPSDMKDVGFFKTLSTYSMVMSLLGLALSGLHLFAGLASVRYKANGPKLAVTYGIAAIGLQLLTLVLIFSWIKPKLEAVNAPPGVMALVGGFAIFWAFLAIIWPVIVLALMTRPGAKAACTN